ncbi:hypothetical protein R3P38DRAFT_2835300 [Favolaschia claudopus]|uniref:MYND-type domain-containing protein n=1 Tax=Favolaschia claudopus TaxID=2862362 RepID=A0AAW0EFZ4_9AGAR
MHPSLELHRLSRLPRSLRTVAMEMICSCPSGDTIKRFLECVSLRDAMDFLPVFFYSLDDSRIPTPDDLEHWNPDTICILASALTSLLFVLKENTPLRAAADLWHRVRAWMQFFWTYDEFLRCLPFVLVPQEELHADMLRFCESMFAHPPNKILFTSTPGFAVFVTRAWSLVVGDFGSVEHRRAIQMVDHLFVNELASLKDLIEGAGGTIHDLAQLCMREVKLAVPDTTRDYGPLFLENMWPLEVVLNFLIVIDNHNRDTSPTVVENILCSALIPLGVVELLTYAANTLVNQPSDQKLDGTRARVLNDLMKRCLIVLEMCFRGPDGHRTLHVAIRFGLLNIMHISSQWRLDDVLDQAVLELLVNFLPRSAMYYNLLPDLTHAYNAIARKETRSSAFASWNVFEAWQRFGDVVQRRFDLLNYFNSEEYEAHRACDNIECGTIVKKRMLKRCAGCSELLYCSRECQIEDWRAGHRRSCASHQAYHRRMRHLYTRKEYSFFRCVFHDDMTSQASEMAYHYIEAWSKYPDGIIATVSDYRFFPPNVGWADSTTSAFEGTDVPGYWNDLTSRARRSCGRLELTVMSLDDGGPKSAMIFPLRRTSSLVPDALKRIAAEASTLSSEEVELRIKQIGEEAQREVSTR